MEPCLTLDSNYTCTEPPPKFNISRPNFCSSCPASPTTEEPTTVSSTLTSTVISTASDIISTIITNASTLTQSSITPGPPTSPSTSKSTPGSTESTTFMITTENRTAICGKQNVLHIAIRAICSHSL
ncbi:uncharacterized protein LOC135153435 [Lytechinus pictus]|uniref:uncharacterized protein LOC135153435 n=1 Tax=Lytechinus pictus TaxID=7653 RepID=UPI0030BA1D76